MSYARSPRLVCSTTMGIRAIEKSSLSMLISVFTESEGLRRAQLARYFGVMVDEVKSLLIAASKLQSIQPPPLCQARFQSCRRLPPSRSQPADIFIHLFFGNLDPL